MSSQLSSVGDLIASMRAAAQADCAAARAGRPGALEVVVAALVLRLLTELAELFQRFQARSTSWPCAPRATRFAGLAFLPRALRRPPLPTWLVRLAPALGLRPSPAPPPLARATRAHPPRNAPH